MTHYLATWADERVEATHHSSEQAAYAHLIKLVHINWPGWYPYPEPNKESIRNWLSDHNITGIDFDFEIGPVEVMA